ncbi:MAG: hypothetical protein KDA85_06795 [Planctomycetaceae bacterium]|nr:hypothetical protein [Planctomycetaceae bacterium]
MTFSCNGPRALNFVPPVSRWALALILLPLFSQFAAICLADEPIGIEAEDIPANESIGIDGAPATPTPEPTEPELLQGPFELVPLFRFGGDIQQLSRLDEFAARLTGNPKWHDDTSLTIAEIAAELSGEELKKVTWTTAPRVAEYEIITIVPTLQPDNSEMMIVMALPMTLESFAQMMSTESLPEPDDDGFIVTTEDGGLMILAADDYLILSQMDTSQIPISSVDTEIRRLMLESLQRIRRTPPHSLAVITFEPGRIRNGLKNPFLNGVISALLTDTQRRDDEEELEYRAREIWGKTSTAALDLVFHQIESATWELHFDEPEERIRVSFNVTAVKNSDLDGWINRQREKTGTAIRWLHPESQAFLSVALQLPETLQTSLPLLVSAFAAALQNEEMISAASGQQLRQVMDGIAASATIDCLLQWIPGAEGQHNFAATIPFPKPLDLTSTAIELVTAINDPAWLLACAEIEGWPVHRYSSSGEGNGFPAGMGSETWVAPTDRQLTLLQGNIDSIGVLSSIVRREYEEPEDVATYRRFAVACRFRLCQLIEASFGSIDDDLKKLIPALNRTTSNGVQDQVTILMHTPPHQIRIEATFDQDLPFAGLATYEGLMMMVVEGINL